MLILTLFLDSVSPSAIALVVGGVERNPRFGESHCRKRRGVCLLGTAVTGGG